MELLFLPRPSIQMFGSVGQPETPRGSEEGEVPPSMSHETRFQPYFSGKILRKLAKHRSNLCSNSRMIFDTSSALNSMSPSFRFDQTILSSQCFGFSPSGEIARVL